MAISRWIGSTTLLSAIAVSALLSGCGDSSATPEGAQTGTKSADPKSTDNASINLPEPSFEKPGDDPFPSIKLPTPEMLANDKSSGRDPAEAAHKGPWLSDYKAALARATAEGKDVLMDFTGSDWCHWCIQLKREVFSKSAFLKYAPDKFVLLELDFPQDRSSITPETMRQNQQLAQKFDVKGYPSIVLADSSGRVYAKTGYQEGGPGAYIPHLEGFRKQRIQRDEAFASAEKATGIERAKLLDEGLKALSQDLILPAHKSVVEEIMALDAQDSAGLKTSYGEMLTSVEFASRIDQINQTANDADDALKQIGRAEIEFKDYRKGAFQLQMFRLQVLGRAERTEEFNKLSNTLLKNKDFSDEERVQVHFVRISGLAKAKKFEEANNVVTEALADVAENAEHSTNLLLFRAKLLMSLKKPAEAKAAIKQARGIAKPETKEFIDQFEKDLLSEEDDDENPEVSPGK